MPTLRELEGWMLPAQAAEVVGWSRQGVIKAAADGRIRGVQVGRAASAHEHVSEAHRFVWVLDPASVTQFAEEVARQRE